MGQLSVLRVIGLSGLADIGAVARGAGMSSDDALAVVVAAEGAGLVAPNPRGYRLTPTGREHVAELLCVERSQLDPATTAELFTSFSRIDREFKELVTEYQLSDLPSRLSWAVARISAVHESVQVLSDRAAALVPRLAPYRSRFDRAMAHLERGNRDYLASVTVDSYHTVWFQFHEELIEMAGRTRAETDALD